MKKNTIILVITLLLSLTAGAQDKKVAVMDPAGSVEYAIRDIVREEISSVVVNASGYTVLERSLINKVLEENKFQQGGLVDDAQISEIGKRMGANLVFISSLTLMGNGNYYISCKMIDVLTARIEKQKTAQTQQGSNDLLSVVQRMTGEMFGYMPRTPDSYTTQSGTANNDNTPNNSKRSQLGNLMSIGIGKEKVPKKQSNKKTDPVVTETPARQETVTYVSTCGIEVMLIDLPGKYTWPQAIRACPDGWRLPTARELDCMCDQKKRIGGFNGKQYWSSTEDAKKKDKAITRTFNNCKIKAEDMDHKYTCRCVRDK